MEAINNLYAQDCGPRIQDSTVREGLVVGLAARLRSAITCDKSLWMHVGQRQWLNLVSGRLACSPYHSTPTPTSHVAKMSHHRRTHANALKFGCSITQQSPLRCTTRSTSHSFSPLQSLNSVSLFCLHLMQNALLAELSWSTACNQSVSWPTLPNETPAHCNARRARRPTWPS
jgi:hypothetical protein